MSTEAINTTETCEVMDDDFEFSECSKDSVTKSVTAEFISGIWYDCSIETTKCKFLTLCLVFVWFVNEHLISRFEYLLSAKSFAKSRIELINMKYKMSP